MHISMSSADRRGAQGVNRIAKQKLLPCWKKLPSLLLPTRQAHAEQELLIKLNSSLSAALPKATLRNLGTVYNQLREHDKAKVYFDAAAELVGKKNEQARIAPGHACAMLNLTL